MPDDISHQLGHLDGRLGALETRVNRLDEMVVQELRGMKAQLDEISSMVSRRGGLGDGARVIMQFLLASIAAASGWIYALTHLK